MTTRRTALTCTSAPAAAVAARPRGAVARLAVALALVSLTLAGCSAGDADGAGSAADRGGVEAPARGGAEDAAEPGGSGGDEADPGDGGAAPAGDGAAAARLVAQTGDVTLAAEDPRAAAREVVTLAARHEGRVDDRYERAGAGDGDVGEAVLTVRVPTAAVTAFTDDLAAVGTVQEVDLRGEDVTTASRDLDARVAATELSVARMADLLARATDHDDVIAAEQALTDRQATLERLRAERDQLADRVALSTLHVAVHGPAVPAPEPAPVAEGPGSFLEGLAVGWEGFVAVVRTVLVVVGVMLPWLVAGGLVVAAVVAVRRARRAPAPQPEV